MGDGQPTKRSLCGALFQCHSNKEAKWLCVYKRDINLPRFCVASCTGQSLCLDCSLYTRDVRKLLRQYHTCEPPARRTNSPVFLGHLPFSNILLNSPDFYMFLPYSPDFYMFTSFAPCEFRPRKQDATCGILNPLHSAEVFYSHFKFCFNNFIYPPWVEYFTLGWWLFEYLLASTVNFKIYIFKINWRKPESV